MECQKQTVKNEILKLLRFAVVGSISFAVDCGVYYLLRYFAGIDFRLIQPLSMSVGLLCSFLINREIVFKKEKSSFGWEALKYLIVCIACIAVSPAIISLYSAWMGADLGKLPATLTTGLLNYICNRCFVYGHLKLLPGQDTEKER